MALAYGLAYCLAYGVAYTHNAELSRQLCVAPQHVLIAEMPNTFKSLTNLSKTEPMRANESE